MKQQVTRAKRTAAWAAAITLLLIAAKAIVGTMARSTALLADAVHSSTDLLAVATSWFGLRIASRQPTERFPYGFYRAETFAALVASGAILYLGGTLLWRGIGKLAVVPSISHPVVAMLTAVLSAAVALALSTWEKRVSRETGSQSLKVTGDETRLDAGTSMLVFVALFAAHFKIPVFEGAATIVISGLVLWTGARNARLNILSLMDASVSPELEQEIAVLLAEMPEVRYVEKVRARRSGPFYFVEGHIHVARSMDVTRSHALSHEAQRAIREKKPQVEGVILHVEPHREKIHRVVVPVTEQGGMSGVVEKDFGRAEQFLIARFDGNELLSHVVEKNPFRARDVRAGLAVANWLVREKKITAAIVREIGEIAYHALRDDYVEVFRAPEGVAQEALQAYAAGHLPLLSDPTHRSDAEVQQEGSRDDEPSSRGL